MKKILIFLTLLSFFTLSLTSCTSSKPTEEDPEVQESSQVEEEIGEELEIDDGEEEEEDYEAVAEGEEEEEEEIGEELEADDGEDLITESSEDDELEVAPEDAQDKVAENQSEGADEEGDFASVPEANIQDESGDSPGEDIIEDDEQEPSLAAVDQEAVPTRAWIPVKKMRVTPFSRGGILANGIYIARDGDTLNSVSEKIYGSNRAKDLLVVNPNLNRGIKVGDKIYYNSPQRPEDNSQTLTFYEDRGVAPQVYISKPNDNIRQVAQKLLGHSRSWMEIYATNSSIDSKSNLMPGTEFRYWPQEVAIPVAKVEELSAPEVSEELNSPPPVDQEAANPVVAKEEPPMEEGLSDPESGLTDSADSMVAGNENGLEEMPPPAAGELEELPPPPPVEPDPIADLPPPPPVKKPEISGFLAENGGNALDQNMIFTIGGVVVMLLGLVFLVIRRRKAARAAAFDEAIFEEEIEETNVGNV